MLAVDVKNIKKTFTSKQDTVEAVKDVSFQVEQGEIFGLLGPNGAGKSTTILMLTTLLSITKGSASILGIDVETQDKQVREKIGVALQDTGIDPILTGRELFFTTCRLWGYSKADSEKRTNELLELVGLTDAGERRVKTYSGGMKRRLDLGLSLVHSPEILFLEFDSSYSAARQVNNEFSLALSEFVRPRIIANFPQRSWRTFITYQTLSYKLTTPMLFESLNNESLWDIKEAWFNCDWIGPHRKPIDPEKEAKANVINVDRGWKTNQKASLEGSGSRFSSNIDRLKGEKKLSEGVIAPPKSSSTVEEKKQ